MKYKVTTSIDNTQEFFDNGDDLKLFLLDKCSLGSKYFDNYIDTMHEEVEIDSFTFKPSDVLKKVSPESYKELYSKTLNQELAVLFPKDERHKKFIKRVFDTNGFWFFNTFHIEIVK